MQMHRFVLWAMLATESKAKLRFFYQTELRGKRNTLGIHEADPFNFLLSVECTTRVEDETDDGLRHRVETLLNALERLKLRTSYSSFHRLVRIILHRPEIFLSPSVIKDKSEASHEAKYPAKAVGNFVIAYIERFQYALTLDPKRLSIAVSAAAVAGQIDAVKVLLQFGATHHVPIEAGSFAHAVECAPDDINRMEIADFYMEANEQERIYTTHDTDSSIANYLLLYAILDGKFTHMMEILREMQLCNNRISNCTVDQLFRSIACYRAKKQRQSTRKDIENKLDACPTILELLETFPNAIPYTTHTFSQAILQSLHAGDLFEALELMRIAFWCKDVRLRPEIYSQLLYSVFVGGQQGIDNDSTVSSFDPQEVERYYDKEYPNERWKLNSLIVNICQSNEDISSMLVCLDRWQAQGHPPMSRRVVKRLFDVISKQIQQLCKENPQSTPGTVFIVNDMQLSHLAFLVRYREIIPWDSWTLERAINRAHASGMQEDVVVLLAQATARGMVLNTAACIASLYALDEIGEPSAVVACVENMKATKAWDKVVMKNPNVQSILDRALDKLQV
ncbi:hypothetical protein PsorP6_001282 [Peronosclerospora sorghi]|uniref:Uncharacterized protein n=1 Tax=Peronosclerospora sorghi TaxID=230839 RepID=A0ACC0WWW2_9STRA|nr:hypothetical protein PsorP6_001282 [Peronosclerospora sorghi]